MAKWVLAGAVVGLLLSTAFNIHMTGDLTSSLLTGTLNMALVLIAYSLWAMSKA